MEVVQMAEKIKPVEKVDDLTPVQRLAKIDADRKELFDSIKAEALQEANEAVSKLNALGFHYLLCEEGEKLNGSKKGEQTGPCPVCKFMTDPPHGGRTHRAQKPEKRPFTDEELKQRNLARV
jgi:hypothetical protein